MLLNGKSVLTVDKHHYKSPITPLNLEEQKARFLRYGILPKFTLSGTDSEIELNRCSDKCHIRFNLLPEAENILNSVKARYASSKDFLENNFGPPINKDKATEKLKDYLEQNKLTGRMSIVWCKDLASSARMLWCGPSNRFNRPEIRRYSFWLKDSTENAYLRENGILCLAEHEIGTHFLRAMNDGFQPWYPDRNKFDLTSNSSYELLCTEEGLASIHSTLRSQDKYLWSPALLYYTACKSTEMSFKELFDHLERFVSDPEQRWKHVMRTKRLLKDVNQRGGYGKDQCYFEGAVSILRDIENIDFEALMSGRIQQNEVFRIKRLARRNIITLPHFMHNLEKYKTDLYEIALTNGVLETALPPHLVPKSRNWKHKETITSRVQHSRTCDESKKITSKNLSSLRKSQTTGDIINIENTISSDKQTPIKNMKNQGEVQDKQTESNHSKHTLGKITKVLCGDTFDLNKNLYELAVKLGILDKSENDVKKLNQDVVSEEGKAELKSIRDVTFNGYITNGVGDETDVISNTGQETEKNHTLDKCGIQKSRSTYVVEKAFDRDFFKNRTKPTTQCNSPTSSTSIQQPSSKRSPAKIRNSKYTDLKRSNSIPESNIPQQWILHNKCENLHKKNKPRKTIPIRTRRISVAQGTNANKNSCKSEQCNNSVMSKGISTNKCALHDRSSQNTTKDKHNSQLNLKSSSMNQREGIGTELENSNNCRKSKCLQLKQQNKNEVTKRTYANKPEFKNKRKSNVCSRHGSRQNAAKLTSLYQLSGFDKSSKQSKKTKVCSPSTVNQKKSLPCNFVKNTKSLVTNTKTANSFFLWTSSDSNVRQEYTSEPPGQNCKCSEMMSDMITDCITAVDQMDCVNHESVKEILTKLKKYNFFLHSSVNDRFRMHTHNHNNNKRQCGLTQPKKGLRRKKM